MIELDLFNTGEYKKVLIKRSDKIWFKLSEEVIFEGELWSISSIHTIDNDDNMVANLVNVEDIKRNICPRRICQARLIDLIRASDILSIKNRWEILDI